jgi:hypothetical protein
LICAGKLCGAHSHKLGLPGDVWVSLVIIPAYEGPNVGHFVVVANTSEHKSSLFNKSP